MITSIFKKSTPFNYIIFSVLILVVFVIVNYPSDKQAVTFDFAYHKIVLLGLFFSTFFILNFIVKKNALTKDSDFAFLFFFLFLLFFPSVFYNLKLLLSNLLVLLALRRLYSIQTLKVTKEKVFDATFYICLASIFQFWSILFLLVVFFSVVFYIARDYKNWLIPFVAIAAAAILFTLYGLIIDASVFLNYQNNAIIDLDFTYFKNNYQNLALSVYTVVAVFFVFSLLFVLSSKPLNKKAVYKQTLFTFFIGVVVFLFSTHKSNEILLFSFFPLSIIATSDIEQYSNQIRGNTILFSVLLLALITFFTQL